MAALTPPRPHQHVAADRAVRQAGVMIPLPDLRDLATLASETVAGPLPELRRRLADKIADLRARYPGQEIELAHEGTCVVVRVKPVP